ncbi:hypothetical protein CORC01_07246 [Colletotrichum orchidophilum]|uniref:Uncharacterized protein n=1 Tax=Colletotrichum orchidophilum TaxID=1209926 RepID=A0A1G4B7U5_9PEZI|nr:uncharacterized protein CORC01_07246 [Colletotrichum orchidophilum]OHE97464.1 hypothetical protein CORC01_07246 [Colletotrichum orchidophilum]
MDEALTSPRRRRFRNSTMILMGATAAVFAILLVVALAFTDKPNRDQSNDSPNNSDFGTPVAYQVHTIMVAANNEELQGLPKVMEATISVSRCPSVVTHPSVAPVNTGDQFSFHVAPKNFAQRQTYDRRSGRERSGNLASM